MGGLPRFVVEQPKCGKRDMTTISKLIVSTVVVGSILVLWHAALQKHDANFVVSVARIKIGTPRDTVVSELGKPASEQKVPLVFSELPTYQYDKKHNLESAYGRSSSANVIHTLVWRGDRFKSDLICFVSFDSNERVVTSGCGSK